MAWEVNLQVETLEFAICRCWHSCMYDWCVLVMGECAPKVGFVSRMFQKRKKNTPEHITIYTEERKNLWKWWISKPSAFISILWLLWPLLYAWARDWRVVIRLRSPKRWLMAIVSAGESSENAQATESNKNTLLRKGNTKISRNARSSDSNRWLTKY